MRTFLITLILIFTLQAVAQVKVRGYYRKNGTYVRPHYRSNPDGNPKNNWSYPGNTNPYTGKTATGNPNTYLNKYNSSSTENSNSTSSGYTFLNGVSSNTRNGIGKETKSIAIRTLSDAKIKEKPDPFSNVIGYIPFNTSAEIIGYENPYWAIIYNGKLAFSHQMFFEENDETRSFKETCFYTKMPLACQNNNELAITSCQAKMKSTPSPEGVVIQIIPKDEKIYIVGFQNNYWRIYYYGVEGYLCEGVYFATTQPMLRFK